MVRQPLRILSRELKDFPNKQGGGVGRKVKLMRGASDADDDDYEPEPSYVGDAVTSRLGGVLRPMGTTSSARRTVRRRAGSRAAGVKAREAITALFETYPAVAEGDLEVNGTSVDVPSVRAVASRRVENKVRRTPPTRSATKRSRFVVKRDRKLDDPPGQERRRTFTLSVECDDEDIDPVCEDGCDTITIQLTIPKRLVQKNKARGKGPTGILKYKASCPRNAKVSKAAIAEDPDDDIPLPALRRKWGRKKCVQWSP